MDRDVGPPKRVRARICLCKKFPQFAFPMAPTLFSRVLPKQTSAAIFSGNAANTTCCVNQKEGTRSTHRSNRRDSEVRVVSWNINFRGRKTAKQQGDLLRELAPDLMLLQEVNPGSSE